MEKKRETQRKMEEKGMIEVVGTDGNVVENPFKIRLRNPYEFEGETYAEIDLSGLEDLTARDMVDTGRILDRSGSFSITPEMTLEYACTIAAKATKRPIEFYMGLHPREAIKVKNRVTSFFYGQD